MNPPLRLSVCTAGALLLLGNLGCSQPAAPATPLALPSSIAVLPPNNLTGDALSVAGASALEKYALHTELVTVPDVLAWEARSELERRGFTVVAPESVRAATGGRAPANAAQAAATGAALRFGGAVLYLEVRRWVPEEPFHPAFVIAEMDAALIDVATGRTLWSVSQRARPIPTTGAVVVGDAYVIAARAAIGDLLTTLTRERAPS